jgi:hypothetical protein
MSYMMKNIAAREDMGNDTAAQLIVELNKNERLKLLPDENNCK